MTETSNQTSAALRCRHWALMGIAAGLLTTGAQGQVLYVGGSDDSILTIAPNGSVSTFVSSGVPNPRGMAFDGSGNLYAGNYDVGNSCWRISKITPYGSVSTFATGLADANGLAFDTSGNLYVAASILASGCCNYSPTIYKITPGGSVSTFASNPPGNDEFANGLAYHGGSFYLTMDGDHGYIGQTSGGAISTYAHGVYWGRGVAFYGGTLYAASWEGSEIFKVSGGTATEFATGVYRPGGLAFDDSGNLYAASADIDTIYKITPDGTVTDFVDVPHGEYLAFGPAPVPEPAACGLVVAGLMALAVVVRRRNRNRLNPAAN